MVNHTLTLLPTSYTALSPPSMAHTDVGEKTQQQNKPLPSNLCSFRKLVGGGEMSCAQWEVWWHEAPDTQAGPMPLGPGYLPTYREGQKQVCINYGIIFPLEQL